MPRKNQPLDSTLHVVTPENIAFEYQLAGPFRRLPALLLDFFFVISILIIMSIVVNSTIGFVSSGLANFIAAVAGFTVWWFYAAIFETFLNGQTPGKYILGLRVLSIHGQPINGMQAVLRALLSTADLFLGVVGLMVMSMNRRYQRLGDLVAGTIVVVEDRKWLTGVAKLDDPRAIQLAAYLPPNFVVSRTLARALSTYVERRRFFTPLRRREVARHLAEPLLGRFGLPPDTSYDLLLCALYYRTFIADRSQDERLLAEAQAAFAKSNPFVGSQPTAASQPAAAGTGITFVPAPVPLPQEQMIGAGFGDGNPGASHTGQGGAAP